MDPAKRNGYRYRICVEGHIGEDWVDWPGNVEVFHTFDQDGHRPVSLISAALPDQPALFGLLNQLRDLNLSLLYAQRDEIPT